MPTQDRSLSGRVYRVLLMAYPKRFRKEYGPPMEQAFGDLCREQLAGAGMVGLLGLWVRTLLDLVRSACVERRSGFSRVNGEEATLRDRRLARAGFALLLAPLFFVVASLLKYGLGVGLLFDPLESAFLSDPERLRVFNVVSPVVFLGGLCLALALNAFALLRLGVGREGSAVVGTVRLETKWVNVAVIAVSFLLLTTLVGYVFLENFAHR